MELEHIKHHKNCPHCGSEKTECVPPERASKKLCENEDEFKCQDCGGLFWKGKRIKGKYQCPHCLGWYTFFAGTDADMGLGHGWNIYGCTNCGRLFDEPPEGSTLGLSRA